MKNDCLTSELIQKRNNNLAVHIAESALAEIPGQNRRQRINTIIRANASQETGIEMTSFDTAIDTMNRIQDEIVWGN